MSIILTGIQVQTSPEIPLFLDVTPTPSFEGEEKIDEDGAGTFVSLASSILGGFSFADLVFIPSTSCAAAAPLAGTLPELADPPFPPTYPYLFSTNQLYGRELMNETINMIRGDTYEFEINVVIGGNPQNLTDYTCFFTAKWDVNDSDANAVLQLTIGDGLTITDAANGKVAVVIDKSLTSGLPAHRVVLPYDFQIVDSTGAPKTPLRGVLVVTPDATISTS